MQRVLGVLLSATLSSLPLVGTLLTTVGFVVVEVAAEESVSQDYSAQAAQDAYSSSQTPKAQLSVPSSSVSPNSPLLESTGLLASTGPLPTIGSSSAEIEGKVFGEIEIRVRDIFDPPSNMLYSLANRLKATTRHSIIMQEVQFEPGDPYNPFLVQETERLLRQLRYLRDARVVPIDRGDKVDILIEVQDTWTVIPQASYSSGDGRTRRSIGISEGNLVGTGNRAELLYREEEGRNNVEAAFDSRRLFNTKYQGQLLVTNGAEGDLYYYDVGDPFRSLAQEDAWSQSSLFGDTIERLFAAGDERFVFRKKSSRLSGSYGFALGDPAREVRRFSVGAGYISDTFSEASLQDFDDINLDPDDLRPEGGELAPDRKFAGPVMAYQYIEQDFVRRAYVDRFSRIEDFNLGERFRSSAQWAPSALGSTEDALLLNTSLGSGSRLYDKSFTRWEFNAESRLLSHGFENSIFSLEGQYIYPLGLLEVGDTLLGNHTIIARTFLDYAEDLDSDIEFLVGGDTTLRGYDARTFTGDKRFALNVEDRIHLIDELYDFFSLGMAFFADAGGATNEPFGELFSDHMYANVGVGLRIGFPKSNGERVARLDFAVPLRDGPDGSKAFEIRLIFAGGQLFGSRLGTERIEANRVGTELGF